MRFSNDISSMRDTPDANSVKMADAFTLWPHTFDGSCVVSSSGGN